MFPVLFDIGPVRIYSFGTMIALAAVAGGLVSYWAYKRHALTRKYLFDTVLYCLLFGLLGARLAYYAIYFDQFQSFWQVLFLWQGGLVATGGILAGFLTFLYFLKKHPQRRWLVADITALSFLAAWTIGKQGCVLSSCTAGQPTDLFFRVNGLFPVDLFSSLWALVLLVALGLFWYYEKMRDGAVFFLALEGFFLGELLIRTLKEDFTTDIGHAEAILYLLLVVIIYFSYWKLYNPRLLRMPKWVRRIWKQSILWVNTTGSLFVKKIKRGLARVQNLSASRRTKS